MSTPADRVLSTDSISFNPDSVLKTTLAILETEHALALVLVLSRIPWCESRWESREQCRQDWISAAR